MLGRNLNFGEYSRDYGFSRNLSKEYFVGTVEEPRYSGEDYNENGDLRRGAVPERYFKRHTRHRCGVDDP